MEKEIFQIILLLRERGIAHDKQKQVPFWENFLNRKFGSFDYSAALAFVKGAKYRVFVNSKGEHKLLA